MQLNKLSLKNKSSHGFTLIEVMIALTIVSIAIIAVLTSMAQSVNNQARLEQKMISSWVAENSFAYLRSLDDLDISSRSESEEMAGKDWYFQERVEAIDNPNLFLVTVTVFNDSGRSELLGTYKTYIAKSERELLE